MTREPESDRPSPSVATRPPEPGQRISAERLATLCERTKFWRDRDMMPSADAKDLENTARDLRDALARCDRLEAALSDIAEVGCENFPSGCDHAGWPHREWCSPCIARAVLAPAATQTAPQEE